jgi:hypothetical protein
MKDVQSARPNAIFAPSREVGGSDSTIAINYW